MNESMLMRVVLIIAVVMVLWTVLKKFRVQLRPKPLSLLKWALNYGPTQKRCLVTVVSFLVAVMMSYLPLPVPAYQKFPHLLNFAISPLMSGPGVLLILSIFIPPLNRYTFGNGDDRLRLATLTYKVIMAIAILQATSTAAQASQVTFGSYQSSTTQAALIALTIVTAVAMLIGIVKWIGRSGIGNGFAIVYLGAVAGMICRVVVASLSPVEGVLFLFGTFALCALGYYTSMCASPLRIKSSQDIVLPLRPTIAGKLPVELALSFVLLPATLLQMTHAESLRQIAEVTRYGIPHNILLALLILGFAYLLMKYLIGPSSIVSLCRKYGYEIESIPIGVPLFVTFITLSFVVVGMPIIFNHAHWFVAGISMVVAGGVIADIVSHLRFYYDIAHSSETEWTICDCVGSEIDAGIKAAFLKQNSIMAMVEPIRFSWGMPARTAVDDYRIYVPAEHMNKAKDLLN